MIETLTKIRKVLDFHQTRVSFEKVLQDYRKYRQELEDEIKTLQILEGLKSTEAACSLLDRLGEIPELMMAAAYMFNEMAKWSMIEKPKSVGPTWFKLGSLFREPLHFFLSLDEAQEIADLAREILVIASRNDFPDMSVFSPLEKVIPKMEPLPTGALVFFAQLDDNDTASDPSNEQVETIQSLLETSRAETRSKVEVKDLDKSVYFDADEEEEPLASSPVKPAKKDEILDWIDERVNKAMEGGSQTSNSKRYVPSKT